MTSCYVLHVSMECEQDNTLVTNDVLSCLTCVDGMRTPPNTANRFIVKKKKKIVLNTLHVSARKDRHQALYKSKNIKDVFFLRRVVNIVLFYSKFVEVSNGLMVAPCINNISFTVNLWRYPTVFMVAPCINNIKYFTVELMHPII